MKPRSFRFDEETETKLKAIQRRHHSEDCSEAVRLAIHSLHDGCIPTPIAPVLGELTLVKQLAKVAQAKLDIVDAIISHFPVSSLAEPRLEDVQSKILETAHSLAPVLREAVASILVCIRAATTQHDVQDLCRSIGALLFCRTCFDQTCQDPQKSAQDRRAAAEIVRQLTVLIKFLESCGIRHRPPAGRPPDAKAT